MTSYGGQAEASLPHWGCDVRNCRHLLGFWEGQRSDVLRGPAHGRSSAVTSYGDLDEASPCLGGLRSAKLSPRSELLGEPAH